MMGTDQRGMFIPKLRQTNAEQIAILVHGAHITFR